MYPAQETARIVFSVVPKSYQICFPRQADNNLCQVKSGSIQKIVKSTFFGNIICSQIICQTTNDTR